MSFVQLWAESESELITEFGVTSDLPANGLQMDENHLSLVVDHQCGLTAHQMGELRSFTIAYNKCLYVFESVTFKPMHESVSVYGGECKMLVRFKKTVDATQLN